MRILGHQVSVGADGSAVVLIAREALAHLGVEFGDRLQGHRGFAVRRVSLVYRAEGSDYFLIVGLELGVVRLGGELCAQADSRLVSRARPRPSRGGRSRETEGRERQQAGEKEGAPGSDFSLPQPQPFSLRNPPEVTGSLQTRCWSRDSVRDRLEFIPVGEVHHALRVHVTIDGSLRRLFRL